MKKIFLAIGFMIALTGCGKQQVESEVKLDETSTEKTTEVANDKKEENTKETKQESEMEAWKTVENEDFKAMFPKEPLNQSTEVPVTGTTEILKMSSYVYEEDEFIYMINMLSYPESVGKLDLSGSLTAMSQSQGGNEIISSSIETNDNGNKILSFKLKNNVEENTYMQGKIILVDRTMYQLMYGYTDDKNFNEKDYDKFINSFELK